MVRTFKDQNVASLFRSAEHSEAARVEFTNRSALLIVVRPNDASWRWSSAPPQLAFGIWLLFHFCR
jgi:hypothetical protein